MITQFEIPVHNNQYLSTKEQYRISNYSTTKDMWNTLKMINNDTIEINRMNTLDQNFELLKKNSQGSIQS